MMLTDADTAEDFKVDKDRHRFLVLEFASKEDAEAFDAAPHNGKIATAIKVMASMLWPE